MPIFQIIGPLVLENIFEGFTIYTIVKVLMTAVNNCREIIHGVQYKLCLLVERILSPMCKVLLTTLLQSSRQSLLRKVL